MSAPESEGIEIIGGSDISEFNKYTVFLDEAGPVKTVQELTDEIKEQNNELRNYRIVTAILCIISIALIIVGAVVPDIAFLIGVALLLLLGAAVVIFCIFRVGQDQRYIANTKYRHALRFNISENSHNYVEKIIFSANYGNDKDNLQEPTLDFKGDPQFICNVDDITKIKKEIVAGAYTPTFIYIYYGNKGEWRSTEVRQQSFENLEDVLTEIKPDWKSSIDVEKKTQMANYGN